MKTIFFPVLLSFLLFQSFENDIRKHNNFSSSLDTLVIKTEKQKGTGLFDFGASQLVFNDSINNFPKRIAIPKSLTYIKYAQILNDFKSEKPHTVNIISGILNSKEIFIVDENINNDFTDDLVRVFNKMDWNSESDLIKCDFLISNGNEIVKDSTWIKIGLSNNNLLFGKSEHLTASFSIDNVKYKVAIPPARSTDFTYWFNPQVAILEDGKLHKDSLQRKDILELNEFLNLNGNYYRFANISKFGDYITLIKENNFNEKVGTQIGMIAPDFESTLISGDNLSSSSLKDKIRLIANTCGCGGDKISTEAFYDIKKTYGDKIYAVRLDSKIDKNSEGLQIDMEEASNKDIYNKYRQAYCSRTCYVIGINNRIIDKFEVADWESTLPQILN